MNATEPFKRETSIAPLLHCIRGVRVILDTDLAKLYGVQTFRLNEAVKRNRDQFDFRFQLTDVEVVVNTVNTVGAMGKGIALMFRERFRDNFRVYETACKAGQIEVGRMFITATGELSGPRWIINFPTKEHWRHPSRLTC